MENAQNNPKTPPATSLLIPSATVFISSFCIMVLELVAARLIARHLGSSLYTWTAVIGVVLAGISLGNYLGGRVADRFPARRALAVLFAISSATCVLTVILNNLVPQSIWLWEFTWPARTFTHVFLVFMLPSTLLGTISPVVAKMALDRGLPTGRTVGTIYAWGAIGSIAGTFAAGYWLIGAMGTVEIVWVVGGILLLMGILYCVCLWPFCVWAVLFLSAMALAMAPMDWCQAAAAALSLREQPDLQVIYQDETPYCYVSVKRLSQDPDKREFVQDKLTHSRIVMGDITDLQYFYTKIYAATTRVLSTDKEKLSVMVIGGGGYVYPRYVEKMWPGSLIEVVEIDPGVTKAAMQAFGLERDTTIKTINMDARNYVDQLLHQQRRSGRKKLFDFVYGDAFNDYSVPYQLLTKEFNDKISQILSDDGAYVLTLIDIYEQGQYLGAVINTLQKTFADVHVITETRMPKWARNTFVVVAAKRKLDINDIISKYEASSDLWHLGESDIDYLLDKARRIVLTDNYAPVENLLAPVVRRSAKGFMAHKYMKVAQRLDSQGRFEESIAFYEKAAEAKSRLTTIAYSEIGFIRFDQDDYPRAVEAFEKALEYNEQFHLGHNLARVHLELGTSLQNLERGQEAEEHFQKAVRLYRELTQKHPDSPELYSRLGSALVKIADFSAAAQAFKRAVDLNPDDLANYVNLAKVLEFQERYDEGISMLQKAIDYMQRNGRSDDVDKLRIYLEVLEFKKWKRSQEQKQ